MVQNIVIGVTGYTGAGKTTVVGLFPKSWKRIDVDALGHRVLERQEIKKRLVAVFGKEIMYNGKIVRQKLRAKLAKSGSIAKLNKIVHPSLAREVQKALKQARKRNNKRNIIIDCALLKELKLGRYVDYILLIDAPQNVLRKRQKRFWTKQEWQLLLQHQKKVTNPDFIIENTGTKEELKKSMDKILRRVMKFEVMSKYSITLSFFIPQEIVQKLKDVKISGNITFNWRNSEFCHCTLKAISLCNKIPQDIDLWAKESEKILSKQKPFKISITDIAKFPTAIFANVQSEELIKLHKKLFKILPGSQAQFDLENYVPHTSLVTLSGEANILSPLKQNFGEFEVKEIQLMVWNLKDLNKSKIYKRYLLTDSS